MANRFLEGFDLLATADLDKISFPLATAANSGTVVAGGRITGNCLRFASAGAAGARKFVFDAQAGFVMGFAFKYAAPLVGGNVLLELHDGTTTHITVLFTTSGTWQIRRNTTLLATSTTALSPGVYYYIEFKFTINDTTGGVSMQINGAAETLTFVTGNATNQDTRNGGNATWDNILFGPDGSGGGTNYDFDDMYIHDQAGGNDDTFWGDIRLIEKTVDGAGNSAQFTPSTGSNWQNVDDATEDGDSTYNESSTLNHIDSMTTQALGVTGTVKGVQLSILARKTDGGAGSLAPFWRLASTDLPGTGVALATDYQFVSQRYRLNPQSSGAWTVTDIDGGEIGYKRTA